MPRPRLDPNRVLTPAERAKRCRGQHGERINRALRDGVLPNTSPRQWC
jgi:hypothetical protein